QVTMVTDVVSPDAWSGYLRDARWATRLHPSLLAGPQPEEQAYAQLATVLAAVAAGEPGLVAALRQEGNAALRQEYDAGLARLRVYSGPAYNWLTLGPADRAWWKARQQGGGPVGVGHTPLSLTPPPAPGEDATLVTVNLVRGFDLSGVL